VVDLTREGDADRGCDHLLQQAADDALVVDLRPERGGAEVVLGANGDLALLLGAGHGATGTNASEGKVAVNAGLDLLGQSAPVRCLKDAAVGDDLSAGHPVGGLVASSVRDVELGRIGGGGTAPEGVDAERQAGCDCLEVASHDHAGDAALEQRGVHCLERGGEVGAGVVVLERHHVALRCELDGCLGDEGRGPAPVEAAGELHLVVDVTLHESLQSVSQRANSATRIG
jgi:hypothetical protein